MTTSILVILAAVIAVGYFFRSLKRRMIDATKCGHKTKIKDSVTAFGQTTVTQVPVSKDGTTPYCHKCLEKMAIRCAWCGKPIFIGDPITLYSPMDKDRKMPDYAVVHNKEHNSYVGCFRWDCAQTGADRAGLWYPPGKVHRVPTAFEMLLSNAEEGKAGAVIIDDLSKP